MATNNAINSFQLGNVAAAGSSGGVLTTSSATATAAFSANLAVALGGTGASTLTANNLIIGAGTSAVTFVAPSTDGKLLYSNGTTFSNAGTITSGAGINVGYSAGTWTISATASGLVWAVGPNGSQAVTAGQGWFVSGAANAFTLPASPTIGDTVEFASTTANSYTITAGSGDTIVFGNAETAATGVLTSDALKGTAIRLVAVSASQWCSVSQIGSFSGN